MAEATRSATEGSANTSGSFGDWLHRRRKALGLTHAALAQRTQCSVSALRKIEQDEWRP